MAVQDRVQMENIQMISQQRSDNATDEIADYDETTEHSDASVNDGLKLGVNAVADPSDLILEGEVSDFPIRLKGRHTPLLQVKNLGHPVVLRADDGLPTILPIQISRQPEVTASSIRTFIGGLSHCYNNLLMGIWGNASLIGMVSEKSATFQTWLAELEDLIENGSNLMHLLFGYIAERRAAARRLRLKQLKIELDLYHKNCGRGKDFRIIEDCLWELSHTSTRPQMAACISRVVDRMQFLLQQKRSELDDRALGKPKGLTHLEKIDALLERGVMLILNLQYYACIRIPVKKSICLKSMLQKKVDNINRQQRRISLDRMDSATVPSIDADPHQVGHAIDQVLNNALQAVSEDGKVQVELNSLYSEAPQDRCGVHMLRDYAVLTIHDNGKGMTTPFQSKIFEPFFTGIKGQGRAGLGLSAAAGIIRAHGGYIQVRSKTGRGSSFKIYLPVE